MVVKTKVSKGFQTVLPASVRKKFEVNPGDEVIWTIIGDEIFVRVRKKGGEDPLSKLIGTLSTDEESDATREIDDVVYGEE